MVVFELSSPRIWWLVVKNDIRNLFWKIVVPLYMDFATTKTTSVADIPLNAYPKRKNIDDDKNGQRPKKKSGTVRTPSTALRPCRRPRLSGADRTVYLTQRTCAVIQAYLAVRGSDATDHVFLYRHEPLGKDLVRNGLRQQASERG